MQIPFSEYPGRHERHFRRKLDNALFPRPIGDYSNDDLLEVQRQDHEEIVAFLTQLRKLVKQAVGLKGTEESEIVLDLKADLEKLYESACRLGDQQANNKKAIADLLTVIMSVVQKHAAGDSKAEQELEQERQARQQHFMFLENPLIADLLDTDSLIQEDELSAVMLSEDEEQVKQALMFLSDEHRELLANETETLLQAKQKISDPQLLARLQLIRPLTAG